MPPSRAVGRRRRSGAGERRPPAPVADGCALRSTVGPVMRRLAPQAKCAPHRQARLASGARAASVRGDRQVDAAAHRSGGQLPMKLIHLTDTHLVEPGSKLYGLDPKARLDAAVQDINRHHADAELAIVTGDLTHWGEADAYRSFLNSMHGLRVPYVVLVGNHDRRRACLDQLAAAPRDAHGFVQGWRDTVRGRLLFLDTLDETSHAGQLCERRLVWAQRALAEAPAEKPIYLFMHHPPFDVGLHTMDRIALADRAAFAEVIRPQRDRIRHLFFGHVHRPICGSWMGIPFSSLRGTNHQVWFDLSHRAPHLTSHEPPAYAVVLIGDETVVVHNHDYLDSSQRFAFSKPGVEERAYALGPPPGDTALPTQ